MPNGKRLEQTGGQGVGSRVFETEMERNAIQAQLERILTDPLFKNSRRYPNLLRYVVESALEGHTRELKERTLGVAVFEREPDYDTSLDPVVRITAAEVRKRLAQYYQDPKHEAEPRIELPVGSYAPEFQPPVEKAPPPPSAPVEIAWIKRVPAGRVAMSLAGLALIIIVAFQLRPWVSRAALDRLWGPVLDSATPVLLCVGQRPFVGFSVSEPKSAPWPSASPEALRVTLFQLYYLGSQNVALPDVTTLGRLAGFLQAKGKTYQIRGESSTTFEDVRGGPVVLIGAFNNDWTMRLMGPQRFSFERDHDVFWLKDRLNPSDKSHTVDYTMPYLKLTEDFALISRVLDPTTERMVVLAGGLTGYGTMAAGEFLSNPAYMETIANGAPGDWARKNAQIVIATKVIQGKSGPPRVVTAHFW
jgi:hypothetical protein